jgi:hypothetical protein
MLLGTTDEVAACCVFRRNTPEPCCMRAAAGRTIRYREPSEDPE